jgi:hypothetical protein
LTYPGVPRDRSGPRFINRHVCGFGQKVAWN